ncbi:MAG: lipo-like protein, partial [Alphaproteobacteria bacterium]|nr:lipo-like protein [Alphaproteobacteria bacterium]
MSDTGSLLDRIGQALGRWLERDRPEFEPRAAIDPDTLLRNLRRGDVLLVEGRAKISTAIKYLTQSTWSHAALYVGDSLPGQGPHMLIEATLQNGVHAVPLSKYERANIRICRAVGLSEAEREAVAQFMIDRIGYAYDLRNIIDLARYLFPTPPIPIRLRRRMLALGSGDPTRAICSSLVAQAFQSVRYPILPDIRRSRAHGSDYSRREIFHIRHHSLFVPRDFDLSPYFEIVKPSIRNGFDHG